MLFWPDLRGTTSPITARRHAKGGGITAAGGISDLIQSASSSDSLGNFVERYRSIKSDRRSRYVDSEAAINRLGYTLLSKKRTADAIEVLKLNTEYYPASANVYDSLGDALAAAGRTDEAIKSYEKAVSIDPNFQTSVDSLRRLKKIEAAS